MQLFTKMYDAVLHYAKHKHAEKYMAGLSCAESTFFPIPPDVMLAPMVLADTRKAWRYATIATIASVVGGIIGYFMGYFAFESMISPIIDNMGHSDTLAKAEVWFREYGVWVVFIAGFSPIPYKIFTLSAGALSMAFLPFVIASLVGRGARFFMVSAFMRFGGPAIESKLKRYIEYIGWSIVVAGCLAYALY